MVLLAPTITRIDLYLKQGSGANILLTVVDKLGNPIVDTTSCSIQAQIKDSVTKELLFEWSTAIGNATLIYSSTPVPKSVAVLTVTGAQSALFNFWIARWDCFLHATGHEPFCLAEGAVIIDSQTTH